MEYVWCKLTFFHRNAYISLKSAKIGNNMYNLSTHQHLYIYTYTFIYEWGDYFFEVMRGD